MLELFSKKSLEKWGRSSLIASQTSIKKNIYRGCIKETSVPEF